VKHIQTIIKTATENETGIESIIDSNGNVHSADLFIDCTGFKSFLLGQTFKEKFIDYSDMLPNNKAWACQVPYVDIEKELQCFTNCTALGNGWVWNTPLFSRIGTGYVYSDRFVSDEAALDEFKSYLCSYKMSTARNKEQVDEYSFRNLSFRSGIHERTFVKNVCAIGLSAGFLEPLESNGLFTIHEFILKLVKTIGRGKISRWDKDVYNVTTRNQFENFAEFVGIHYALSQRTDTEYWRYNFNKNFDKDMLSLAKKKTTGYFDLANQYMFDWTFSTDYPAGTHFIATGMDYRPLDECRLTMAEWLHRRDYKNLIDQSNEIWKKKQCQWIAAAEASPTHYHYLKNTIYKDI
jgi:tryptophan halogenase